LKTKDELLTDIEEVYAKRERETIPKEEP